MNRNRALIVPQMACLAMLLSVATGRAREATPAVEKSQINLKLRGGNMRAEVFALPQRANRPGILVLHGAGGTLLDGPEMRRVARYLAADGNTVYLLHYFQETGTLFALDSTMQKNFETWLTAVREAIVAVQKIHSEAAPIGIYGYSLGGFLALLAASDNPAVGAVVEHAGGIWNSRLERVGKMPPVLMIHGREDARVPFEKYAKPIVPLLRRHAPTVETRFFPEEGHGFTPAAMTEVREDARKFFRRYLAQAQPRER